MAKLKFEKIPEYDMIEDNIDYIQVAIYRINQQDEISEFFDKFASNAGWCIIKNGDLRILGIRYQLNMSYAV